MTNLKDNDMDDLFRRASDKYPLRTDSADWDRMAATLDKDPTPNLSGPLDEGEKRRKRRFFWLFLLLPLAGIGYFTWHQTGKNASHPNPNPAVTTSRTTPGDASSANAPSANAGAETPAAVNPGAGDPGTASTVAAPPGASVPKAAASKASAPATAAPKASASAGTPSTSVSAGTATTAGSTRTRTKTGRHKASSGTTNPDDASLASNDPSRPSTNTRASINDAARNPASRSKGSARKNHRRPTSAGDKFSDANGDLNPGVRSADQDENSALTGNPVVGAANIAGSAAARAPYTPSRLKTAQTAGNYNLAVNVKAPVMHKDSSLTKTKASAKPKSSFMYAGISGAPDLSTVKFQNSKGVGTTFGVLLGYAFNKRWAVESGVYLDRKKYYTDGEYFNTKGVNLSPNLKLISVDGSCYMWEVPVNVRYNFTTGEKMKWFATAGLSTYFMTREKYYYDVSYNSGNPWQSNTPWDLKKPSQYWFSIVSFSAGFEQRLGKVGNLRIEPYVRLPLSGLGTGKLNIMSTGLNIGITRRLW